MGKVDGVFFEEIDTVLAVIGNNGNLRLQFRNFRIFDTTSSRLNCGSLIILTRSSYALVAKENQILCNKFKYLVDKK